MKIASAKSKARTLQKWVVAELLKRFSTLTAHDIKSTSMGVTGEDVSRSAAARELIPYQFECKNQERFRGLYGVYEQATGHGTDEPIVIVKSNRQKPLAIICAQKLFDLIALSKT